MAAEVIVLLLLGLAVIVGMGVPLLLLMLWWRRSYASRSGRSERRGGKGSGRE